MIQLTHSGLTVEPAEIERLGAEFREREFVKIPGLLSPEFLSLLQKYLDLGVWEQVRDYYTEERFHGIAFQALHFAANRPALLSVASAITGLGPFRFFMGRVFRRSAQHSDDWHNDVAQGRVVAMSINLGPQSYRGGILQIRDRVSHELLAEIENQHPGDAILFAVSPHLEHRVTPVEGDGMRTAFAGWFDATDNDFWAFRRPGDGPARSTLRRYP